MLDVLIDAIIDTIKLIPFLFVAFLIMEYFEHKLSNKNKNILEKSGKYGPLIGSIIAAFPQCGFGVLATNLYAARIITLGMLISIYLSTSDEMLPIMISEQVDISIIIKIILIKVIISMICGFLIDLIIRKKEQKENFDLCDKDHCHCEHSIIKSSIKHTINITIFIFVINLILNFLLSYVGEDEIGKFFLKNTIFSPFISGLVGMIPNCAASVFITELYLKGILDFGSLLSGLLTGAGVSLLLLFKVNKNKTENIKIVILLYIIGTLFGLIFHFLPISLWKNNYNISFSVY